MQNRGWGLRAKLSATFGLVSLLIVVVYSIYAYDAIVGAEMRGVDQRLMTAAYATQRLVGIGYHDQLPASDPNDLVQTAKLTDFTHVSDLAYVYTTIERNGRVLYTTSSGSPDEVRAGKFEHWYLAEYKQVPQGLSAALNDGKVHFEEYRGEYGLFRSVFAPFTSANGVRYVVGVDVSLSKVEALRSTVLWQVLGFGLVLLVLSVLVASLVAARTVKPVNELNEALKRLAGGDWNLVRTMPVHSRDEVGRIAESFNTFMAALRKRLLEIQHESREVENVSHQLSELVGGVVQRSRTQAEDVHGSAAALEELATSVSHVSNVADDASRLMDSFEGQTQATVTHIETAVGGLHSVQQEVTQLATQLDQLDARANEINKIVGVIKDIADQTNLLALNAAIEAARAGEQGRGFAVVADEVRKLSERTASATVEIGGMIDSIQQDSAQATSGMRGALERVDASVHHAGDAQATLHGFTRQIEDVVRGMGEISSAVREQANASQQLAGNVESVSNAADSNRQAAENSLQGAASLLDRAKALGGVVRQFTL
ncbi:methyl-accepting chemotaxis protein [Crenobacter sp. SG2303]|uniref:Methyl-accepting chemotaxis protein n=1 Tax=Crenobacter oryzisoli TaxID=3056844 RepID=A0ABT7XV78_9NEIS|nr:methyl-accepting chemotaxis protein [Crenobacter sp. SG2303]MDN0077702.1 methyl-accepting chemotaxis protein [Crenobacter sp. SG2303]